MPDCATGGMFLRVLFLFVIATALPSRAQLTFGAVIDLAVKNSPKVKSAQQDVNKAAAALAVTKDLFIPSVVTSGGVGTAYGITLNVPTIFTINAQSLVYSAQQRFYIRAARSDLRSAELELADARDEAEEDAAITYLSIDHAQKSVAAITEQYGYATRLVAIVEDRVNGKLDSDLDLLKAHRSALQLKLQKLNAQDDLDSQRDHLAQLIGRAGDTVSIISETIPPIPGTLQATMPALIESAGLRSAQESAAGKRERAHADSIYTWRPQVSFAAQYGRVSPIENVSEFYNIHGNYNTASIGFQINFPLLDRVRTAAAQQSTADALRSENELLGLRFNADQEHKNLLRSIPELETKADLAGLEQKIAEGELSSILLQMKQGSGAMMMTPKDEMNARIQERQKYLDALDARLQLAKSQISLLRQTGGVHKWLQSPPTAVQPAP